MKKILTLLLFLFAALVSNAQNLTINFSDCTIEEAMSHLKNEGISFILKSDSIDMDAKVNANFTDASLETIVRKIFENQNVSLIISDSVVVVSAKSEPVQTMRKDADFNVTDHIAVYVNTTEKLADILTRNKEEVMGDVLADELYLEGMEGYTADWNINGEKASVGVKVLG